ncbi:DUF421 domain-containing protein [Bacillus dakarensis]|uniref:DUF421 domain-containing protein n=1 Tax=Robertmurraya dakarensis TaxID=1926278 RepID=UPI0009823841|nr:DUF421 domain-containing protein [Bacillus dakarensis]
MDWSLLWKAGMIVIGGTLLLRIAGRKSISQMTLAQTVIMVGIGSLLVQPIVGKSVWSTLAVGFILVTTLVVIEFIQVKTDFFEKFITGKSKILVENGQINIKNLKKLRMTVDQLEMQFRQNNVTNISDVQYATLEPNGQVGFVLNPNKQNATKEDIQRLVQEIEQLKNYINTRMPRTKIIDKGGKLKTVPAMSSNDKTQGKDGQVDLFEEVLQKKHKHEPPKYLQ